MKSVWPIAHLRRRTSSGLWIPELDGLRFIAIVSVILYHLHLQLGGHFDYGIKHVYAFAIQAFSNGNRGVALFFTISGFILSRPFALHHLFGSPAPSLRKYFIRRITRLEPPYIFNLIVVGLGVVYVGHESWRDVLPHLLASILYLHYFFYRVPSTINFVAWSLEVEVQFYIIAPLLAMLFVIKQPIFRRVLTVVLMLSAAVLQSILHLGTRTLAGQIQFFLAGLLFADLYLTVMPNWKSSRLWDLISLAGWPAAFLLSDTFARVWLPFLALLLYIAAFRGVMMCAILRNAWVAVIGGMCYTIYLWHTPTITIVNLFTDRIRFLKPHDYALLFLIQGIIKVLGIAAVSVPLFVYLERPCMDPNWPRKLAGSLHGGAGAVVTPEDTEPLEDQDSVT